MMISSDAHIIPDVASGSPFDLVVMSFLSFFEHFLVFWHDKMSHTHVVPSPPSSGLSHFSKTL